jgi:hypothetical protein
MADLPLMQIQIGNALNLTGSSFLRYRDILLADVLTEFYEMKLVQSPDKAQDLSIHHILKVSAIINPAINSFQESPGAGGVATRYPLSPERMAENAAMLKKHLLVARGPLDYYVGGVAVLQSPVPILNVPNAQRYPCDSNHGPLPLYCDVSHITGTSTFLVRFGIETWIDACVQSPTPSYIHSHRFSMTYDVDGDSWLTARTVTGHVKFRPEFLERTGIPPDQVERKYFHPELPGFKRHNVRVQALPNGMEVAYSFTDTEQTLPLGSLSPATKLTAEFMVSSGFADGKPANTIAAIHVAAVGPKNQFRINLLIMAIKIGLRKLQKPGLIQVREITVTYSLDNTFVDLTMKAIWNILAIGPDGMHLPMTGLLGPDDKGDLDRALSDYRAVGEAAQGSQPDKAQSPNLRNFGSRGSYAGFVIGSAIVNGCFKLDQPVNYIWNGTKDGKTIDDIGFTEEPTTLSMITDAGSTQSFTIQSVTALSPKMLPTGYSPESTNGRTYYEDYQLTTSYRTNHQKAVLPVGATQGASPGDVLTYVPPEVASLGFPYTLKVVDFDISAVTDYPSAIIIPSPDTGDPDDVLLAEDVSPAAPAVANSSSKTWRITGTYWYLCKKLQTSSLQAKTLFDYTDQGRAAGRLVTDSYPRASNVIGLLTFKEGYVPKSSPG